MIAFTPYSRANRALFVISIVCLLTTLAATVFVAARGGNEDPPKNGSTQNAGTTAVDKAKISRNYGRLPLSFERNEGQVDRSVKFVSRGPGYDLFLTGTEAVLSLLKPVPTETEPLKRGNTPGAEVREGTVLRLKMLGANPDARVEGQNELPGKVNYFIGNDPENWRRNVPTYRKVNYKDVYPGIDVVYYGNQQELEYDFVVAPGADPKVIKFRVDGAERISLDETGGLVLAVKDGEVRLNKPFIYQLGEKGDRTEVKGAYAIKGKEISFKLRGFDSDKPLVIDPVLSYATFLGSSGNDHAFGIAVDSQGSAYVTGVTLSSKFPTTAGSFKPTSTTFGAFVSKLDPTGSTLVYSTYLNGRNGSTGNSIAVDSSGNAYVTGDTSSPDFPIVNGLKTASNFFKTTDSGANWNNVNSGLTIEDVRAIAVAPTSPNTVYAALIGGVYRSTDGGATWTKTPTTGLTGSFILTVAVDPTNASIVYVAPGTGGGNLFRSTNGGDTWTQVTGASSFGNVNAIVWDPVTTSTMYVAAGGGVFKSTDSGNTWTPLNSFSGNPVQGPPNVRALAIDPTTTTTMYAGTSGSPGMFKTTNGGASWVPMNTGMVNAFSVNTVVIDPFNSQTVYAGSGALGFGDSAINKTTNGGTSWTPLTLGVTSHGIPAIVADRSNASTFYAATQGAGIIKTTNGGTSWTPVNSGVWRPDVNALVAHPSNSSILFAAGGGNSFHDTFVTKLNSSGSGLLFSSFLGGMFSDTGYGIAVDSSGNIYVVGQTNSPNYPAVNALQPVQVVVQGGSNCNSGFISKINPAVPSFVFSTYLDGNGCDAARAVAVDTGANAYITGFTASTDFPTANAFQSTKSGSFENDAFVTKLSPTGSLVYSTYLGGASEEIGFGIAVDAAGNAHVTGRSLSSNFPTLNAIQATNGGGSGDVFVTKFNGQGSGLLYSTFLGGTETDEGRGIALDSGGNAYITGFTNSVAFPLVAGSLGTKSGLFKSVDSAATWSNDNYGLKSAVNDLVIHPTQPSTIYAATDFGVFKSTDGGRNWTPMNNGLNSVFARVIVIDPVNPSTLYVAINGFSGSPNDGVYKSTDGGNSWNLRKTGLISTPVSLAINPATPTTLYAASSSGPVFKTTDGADNWARSGTGGSSNASNVAVDPKSPATVFANELFSDGGIWRSADSGDTWQKINADPIRPGEGIVASPHTASLVFATGNGGVWKSVDNGNNWTQVRTGVGFARVTFDPVSSSTVYVASGIEGVLKSTDTGQTWTKMNQGLSSASAGRIAIDPLRPATLYVASSPQGNQADAFVSKINPTGSTLIYSTLIGGPPPANDVLSLADSAFGIAVDSNGNAYITGNSGTQFQTTPNSYQPLNRGGGDAFIVKLTMSHVISGQVKDGSSAPISGAEVVLNDGTSIRQVTTESDGSYVFTQLREGGSFTVSASKPHFTMAPTSQTFNNLAANQTQDFTATATAAAFHTISGQITNNGAALANVTVTLSGSQSGLRTTDSNGNYSFELAGGGNYTVTPSIIGFTFAPLNHTFNNLSAPQTANFAATRQNFVVTTVNNHGAGSLREAMTNANATPGLDTIVFNIPGPGVKVISLVNALPDISDPVVIDGATQPGYAGTPLVELDGSLIGDAFGNVLVIKAGGSTVRGLAIGRSSTGILISNCDNNVIQGNHLGVDATGTASRQNGNGMRLVNSSNNLIGGTTAAARNVISANGTDGIEISGNGNIVQGNYIGTNAAATAAMPNGQRGVNIQSPLSANNVIGGTAAGAGNLISGNDVGIRADGTGTTIQGNFIGTNAAGTERIGNGAGIVSQGPNTQIGGLTAAARNIISGNGTGVSASGTGSKIEGNFIGTDITGTLPLGNTHLGVGATNVLIGGTTPEARNIISANGFEQGANGNVALGFNVFGPGGTVQGNYIGTDVTGTKALRGPGSAVQFGITVMSNNHVIGGTDAGAANVISGHDIGIQLGGFSSPPTGVVVQGNIIGLNAQGTAPLPNLLQGIRIFGDNNIIGGVQAGAANKIAFSGADGVEVNSGAGNSIRGNSIFSNGDLGIDLGFTSGVTPNDGGDVDAGANNLQNFPVLTSVTSGGGNTTIQGSLNSTPNQTFHIDFYSNAAGDASGHGEGALFFNTTQVTTNASGTATINVTFPMTLPAGRVITATATSPSGSTSEFSAVDAAGAAGTVQFAPLASFIVLEDIGQVTVTVQRVGGSTGSLSVEYATADGTAIAGQDYTATSGTLNFANGETTKTFQVSITDDAPTETDENFTVLLRNPSTLEALGMPLSMAITIQDKTTVPTVFMLTTVVLVTEGDTGTTTDARFDVHLSAATGRTVSVNFATQNIPPFNGNVEATGGAACGVQGVDYESKSGTITFQPGTILISVPVRVCGDSSAERNEAFGFALTNPVNATIPVPLADALGGIVNDDVIQLLLEEAGPGVNQAVALDALTMLRDPFQIVSVPEHWANGTDRNTRVAVFVRNLQLNPGETTGAVVVRLIGSNNQIFDVPAEDFRAVPGTDFMQVTFRLPNTIAAGTAVVTIRSHLRVSNLGTMRIAP